jgi:hypothetical protein
LATGLIWYGPARAEPQVLDRRLLRPDPFPKGTDDVLEQILEDERERVL